MEVTVDMRFVIVGVTMEYLRVLTVIIILLTYLIVPGKAEFTVQPVSVDRAEGLVAVFTCQYQMEGMTITYEWAINNSLVSTDTDTVRARPPSSLGGPTTLTILATPQHNNSVVQCVATIRNGFAMLGSNISNTTLTVHGTVITNVLTAPNTITVMWNALPLTEYCVDINKTTFDSTDTVNLDYMCGLTNWYIFMYSNHSVCDRFSFTVTPTEGEMRGTTSEPDTRFFTRAEGSGERHRVRNNGEKKSVEFEATIPRCTRFTRYRVDSDLLTPSISRSITDPLFNGSLSFSLPTDKMTEYSVTLTDENGIDLVFKNIPINTFDVQGLLVSECPGGGGICVKIVYVEGTVSPGALVCAVRIIDGVFDFANMKLVTIARNSIENFTMPVPSGEYRVIAFDLESNHLPNIPVSMVALSQDMTANSIGEDATSPPPREGISATNLLSGEVEVTCSDSARNCLVLFQPTIISDRVPTGFINASSTSTVLSLNNNFGDGYVVVYSWNSSQSIFEGEVSLVMQLDLPTSTPTIPPTSDPQTDPPPPDIESLLTSVIAATIVTLVVIITSIVLIIVVVLCLVKKIKRGGKGFRSRNSEGGVGVDVGASQVVFYDVARPEHMSLEYNTADTDDTCYLCQDVGASIISPVSFYDVARPEHMSLDCNTADTDDTPPPGYDVVHAENMPEYETIALALAGEPTPTTSENPPPLPLPTIQGDEGLENDVMLTEETTSTSQAKDEPTEDGGDDGLEAMITAQHQYTLVIPKPASGDAKVKDSSTVIYSEVDKDKLKPFVPPPVAKAQGQYIPVETRPASSDAEVMDSTKVVYVQVDKDKLKPVDPNDPPALPPRRPVTNTEELHTEKTLALPPRRPVTNTGELHTEKTLALAPRQRHPPPPPIHKTSLITV